MLVPVVVILFIIHVLVSILGEPTLIPSKTPTQLPTIASVFSLTGPLQLNGSYYLQYSSLPADLSISFSISLWVIPFALRWSSVLISLGRSPSNYNGEFVLSIDPPGTIQYYEYNNEYGISLSTPQFLVEGMTVYCFIADCISCG